VAEDRIDPADQIPEGDLLEQRTPLTPQSLIETRSASVISGEHSVPRPTHCAGRRCWRTGVENPWAAPSRVRMRPRWSRRTRGDHSCPSTCCSSTTAAARPRRRHRPDGPVDAGRGGSAHHVHARLRRPAQGHRRVRGRPGPLPRGTFVRYDGEARPPVTDGPFAETKDLIAGWLITDVNTYNRASRRNQRGY